jgi:formylmethanofuran dehydrogenase subunit E
MRQKQILTRLLQSEKAELEREKEEKRESTEGKNVFLRNPEDIFKYKKVQNSEVELFQPVPASLTPFYKKKVNQYFFNFEELLEQ